MDIGETADSPIDGGLVVVGVVGRTVVVVVVLDVTGVVAVVTVVVVFGLAVVAEWVDVVGFRIFTLVGDSVDAEKEELKIHCEDDFNLVIDRKGNGKMPS